MLASIRTELGSRWRYVGYALELENSALDNIKSNFHKVEDQAFEMLKYWIQTDVESCYCKLISAMNEEGLVKGIEILKGRIQTSEYRV